MGYKETGIVQVVCKAADGTKVIYKNNTKMQPFQIPYSFKTVSYITGIGQKKEYLVSLLDKIKKNEIISSDEEKKQEQDVSKYGIEYTIEEEKLPKASYTDVTEHEMFGFPEISKNVLTSQDNGLWAYHGLRKLKFHLSELVEDADEWEKSAVLYFNKKDNDEIPEIRMEEIGLADSKEKNCYELYIYVDTNKMGDEFDLKKQKILFSGFLEFSFSCKDENINDVTYCFPVELRLNNTHYENKVCVPLQKNTVSIDFGTSSSCVAVNGENNIELLTISSGESGKGTINIYENPTCVMLYRWDEIYQQWQKENPDFPLMIKGNINEEREEEKAVQFDFGYSIKEYLNEVSDSELNAILTEIKMMPKMLQEGTQISVRPLVPQSKKIIEIVDSYEEQNDEKLDIVAFYGYILGKAINRVEKNKIYTKYQVTYPVKFNDAVKNKLCASLEYGLRRSLPIPLRNAVDAKGRPVFKVETKYPEPVAYIGSVCGKYLKIDSQNPQPILFAVYDFGGGTLDYSFGVFAPDPESDTDSIIYILGVDGDSEIGGELLIKKMSYWVYTNSTNCSQFVENGIPFEKPSGEILPDDCPEQLFNKTASAQSNVRKMNERITRDIFEGKTAVLARTKSENSVGEERKKRAGLISGLNSRKIDFLDLNDEIKSIDVSFDIEEINERLEKILRQTVVNFKNSLERILQKKCGDKKFDIKEAHIFKAGNSSKNKILEKIMREEFPENEILLVDETDAEFMHNLKNENGDVLETREKQVAITPKTAVAIGQLKLGDYVVDSLVEKGLGNAPFNWFVGIINRGNNEFKMIIDKVNPEDAWIKYGRINSEDMKIYYSETPVKNADDTKLKSVEISDNLDEDCLQKDLYIRIKDANTILCCICERKKEPDDSAEVFETLLI